MNLKQLEKGNVQFALLIVLLAFYILTKNIIFAVLIAVFIVVAVAIEINEGIKKHGLKQELGETVLTIIIALAAWFSFQYIMNTETPLSAVVSCSMVPSLNRGDLIIVKGEDDYKGPTIHAASTDIAKLNGKAEAYKRNEYIGDVEGSILTYCQTTLANWCKDFAKNPELYYEKKGNFVFKYKMCTRVFTGLNKEKKEPCLESIGYKNSIIQANKSNDVIVYRPRKGVDAFGYFGDIVHRVYAKLVDESGNVYYLTKGDNNNVADVQFFSYLYNKGNGPPSKDRVLGKVVFSIPYIGYYKLFLSLYFKEDPLCNTILMP